jgi:ACS family glucarate transporter-like MFS transporter
MRTNRHYAIYVLLLLFLAIYSLGRATMAVAGSSIAAEMHIGPVALGYLFSAATLLMAAASLVTGGLRDAARCASPG